MSEIPILVGVIRNPENLEWRRAHLYGRLGEVIGVVNGSSFCHMLSFEQVDMTLRTCIPSFVAI